MTWLLHICFSLLAAVCVHAATVSGTVSLEGSKDKRVTQRRDYSSVVVWLEPAGEQRVSYARRTAVMEQKNKTFLPHVLAIPVGSSVDFPNFDPIFHNAFSNFDGQMFDVGLYPPKTSRSVRFNREGIARVFCNIHPAMSAVIVVLRTAYFDVTGKSGAYRISEVPSGDYTLKVFHERATEGTLAAASRKVRISGDLVIPPFAVSEACYLPLPHKNKYGKEYPAVVRDTSPYPGGPG